MDRLAAKYKSTNLLSGLSDPLAELKSLETKNLKSDKEDNFELSAMFQTSSLSGKEQKNVEAQMKSWNFDQSQFGSTDLATFAAVILVKNNVDVFLGIAAIRLCQFCIEVERSYKLVPYHNFRHGFTVMHITGRLLSQAALGGSPPLNASYRSALLLSSLCHDIFHDGRTNAFHVSSQSNTALEYSSESTLEHMHVAKTMSAIKDLRLFEGMRGAEAQALRKNMTILILSTDMKMHNEVMEYGSLIQIKRTKRGSHEKQLKLSKMIIHCADISNPTMSPALSHYWSSKVLEEFTLQIEEEETLGIQQSLYLKAKKGSVEEAKLHRGFITTFVLPSWLVLQQVFPPHSIYVYVQAIQENIQYWDDRVAALTTT